MEISTFIDDDDAVSPVIGVILMVAITVILAAVIATFVLGLGDQVSNTTPQASFSFDFDESSSSGFPLLDAGDNGDLTITHDGGDSIDSSRVSIVASPGGTAAGGTDVYTSGSKIMAGSSATVNVDTDATVRVTYSGQSGDNSATLAKWEGPDA